MSKQDATQATTLQRPTTSNPAAWKAYWEAQGQPWRTEPEIDTERQTYLAERRNITPDIEQSIYPFKDIRLSRADVEWLLAIHENGRGPIDWSDEKEREREGLDLRVADLCEVNLQGLPLARMIGGLNGSDWDNIGLYHPSLAGVHLERAVLDFAHLEGAILNRAHLEKASLSNAHLEEASVNRAFLERAYLKEAHLEKASFRHTHLERSYLGKAHFAGADLTGAHLEGANLFDAYFVSRKLSADSSEIPSSTNLRNAYFDDTTTLQRVNFGEKEYGFVLLADVRWGGVNLAALSWSQMKLLGDEEEARQRTHHGNVKQKDTRLSEYEAALRAYRQLAIALQTQGLNEAAARFAYRAQVLQRKVLWLQMFSNQGHRKEKKSWRVTIWQRLVSVGKSLRKFGFYIFLLFLDLLAGYGYRSGRTLGWYLIVIGGFAIMYAVFGHLPLLPDTLVFSLMSFHGRGFFPSLGGETSLHNPVVVIAAFEAVVGLLIEISFIATFTQRFFGK